MMESTFSIHLVSALHTTWKTLMGGVTVPGHTTFFTSAIKGAATSVVLPLNDSSDTDKGTRTEVKEGDVYTLVRINTVGNSSSKH